MGRRYRTRGAKKVNTKAKARDGKDPIEISKYSTVSSDNSTGQMSDVIGTKRKSIPNKQAFVWNEKSTKPKASKFTIKSMTSKDPSMVSTETPGSHRMAENLVKRRRVRGGSPESTLFGQSSPSNGKEEKVLPKEDTTRTTLTERDRIKDMLKAFPSTGITRIEPVTASSDISLESKSNAKIKPLVSTKHASPIAKNQIASSGSCILEHFTNQKADSEPSGKESGPQSLPNSCFAPREKNALLFGNIDQITGLPSHEDKEMLHHEHSSSLLASTEAGGAIPTACDANHTTMMDDFDIAQVRHDQKEKENVVLIELEVDDCATADESIQDKLLTEESEEQEQEARQSIAAFDADHIRNVIAEVTQETQCYIREMASNIKESLAQVTDAMIGEVSSQLDSSVEGFEQSLQICIEKDERNQRMKAQIAKMLAVTSRFHTSITTIRAFEQ